MSMGYTSDATMSEPALRDIERWKDKIEVRLDNRQVFFLFIGSALVACLLFVLGVIVGKRLESRGRAEAPAIEDPLALLDRVAAAPVAAAAGEGLTFPRELLGGGAGGGKAKPAAAAPVSSVLAAAPAILPAAPSMLPVKVAAAAANTGAKPSAGSANGGSAATTVPSPPVKVPAAAPAARGSFTLQISSFQDRAEAEEFAKRFSGESTYIITSDIPGKGTWYRVRLGSYGSAKEASEAKLAFERKHSVIAYVAGR